MLYVSITMKIFVGNIPYTTTEDELHRLFSLHAEIISVVMPRARQTQLPRGFAFVECATREDAEKLMEVYQDYMLENRALQLSWVKDSTSYEQ